MTATNATLSPTKAIRYTPRVPTLMRLLGARGWTWARLAREANVDRPYLCRIMGGHHRPGPAIAEDVAAALGVEILEIWEVAGA